jgi:bifunctional DNA-binding transcriptional regulator/antitoxin component of YhaV-PrlF toxin-antitoxin module
MICTSEQRKIQKVRYTYQLSIPVRWIRNMKIVKGDTFDIEIKEDNTLRITPAPQVRQNPEGTGSSHLPTERGDAGSEF